MDRFLEQGFRQPGGTPNLQVHVLGTIESLCIEHRGEIDAFEMTAKERREPVLGQVLDPFRSGSVVKLRVVAATMAVGHSRTCDILTLWVRLGDVTCERCGGGFELRCGRAALLCDPTLGFFT